VNYYLARNGQQQGPYSIEDLQRMVASGSASAADLVWKEGMPSWVPLQSVIPSAVPQGFPPPLPTAAAYGYQPPAAGGYPLIPPSLHWGLVLLFGWLSGGLFQIIWAFVQANFVKKIDPSNSSLTLFIVGLLGFGGCFVLFMVGIASSSGGTDFGASQAGMFGLAFLLEIGAGVCLIVANFKIRRSMLNYYNSVEPIGLRLSGAMTFFFNILYFQHHFTRIAKWKQTGYLEPQ